MIDISKLIKMAMLVNGDINGAELSRRLGVAPQNLNRKMHGTSWKVEDLEQIADALDCDLLIDFKPRHGSDKSN